MVNSCTRRGGVERFSKNNSGEQIANALSYARTGMPLGLVLENAFQESLTHLYSDQTLPLGVVQQGSIFALWKHLDDAMSYHPANLFHITAGASSLFMLPNIGNEISHKYLKRDFGVSQRAPKTLAEHWGIFKKIANHPDSNNDWQVSLLLFTDPWVKALKSDPEWNTLYAYLLQYAWQKSAYDRNRFMYDFANSCIQNACNLKPNPYIADTFTHLITIASGSAVGFRPAMDNTLGPIDVIQRAYLESYGMKRYAPIIMQPSHFDLSSDADPIYYSLQYPTTLVFSPRARKLPNTLFDLAELKHILEVFRQELSNEAAKFGGAITAHIVNELDFHFYHNKLDAHQEVELTDLVPQRDERFLKAAKASGDLAFAENGCFVRGCVQIKHKEVQYA